MFTGLITIVGAIFSAICSAVAWIVKTMPPLGWLLLVVLVIGLWLGRGCSGTGGVPAGCSCRELVCGCRPRPIRPERTHIVTGAVVSVDSARTFTVLDGRRNRLVTIRYIVADGSQAATDYSAALLPVGSAVTIAALGGRIFGSDPGAQDGTDPGERGAEATDSPGLELEARGPLVGEVTSANGANVGIELIRMGYATVDATAPKSYQDAAKQAAKKRK